MIIQRTYHRGILLIEVLLAVAFLAALVAVGTQVAVVSMQSTTASEYKDVAQRLGREMLEGARLASESDWYQVYHASRSAPLVATTSARAWVVRSGPETLTVGTHIYTRSFTVASTSRDQVTRAIQDVYDPAYDDPSTLRLTATVQVREGGAVTLTEYITRWHNVICDQTEWATGAVTDVHTSCATVDYDETTVFPSGSVETTDVIQLAP